MLCTLVHLVVAQQAGKKIVLTNDDGWAVANIRAQRDALVAAGYDVILSCPAINKSGTASNSTTPAPLQTPCEFNTCPAGSPATGFNASDPRLNYVNAFPADASRFGIQTLAPKFFNGSAPDFVFAGPNVGSNTGPTVQISGTVGAAVEAVKEGIPAVGFSGPSGAQVSYTTLESDPNSASSLTAFISAELGVKFTNVLLAAPKPILPSGIVLNVNYPSTGNCTDAADFKFVLSRILPNSSVTDVETCGSTHLPAEDDVIHTDGCFTAVSVYNASTKADVDAATQKVVLDRISSILTCLDED